MSKEKELETLKAEHDAEMKKDISNNQTKIKSLEEKGIPYEEIINSAEFKGQEKKFTDRLDEQEKEIQAKGKEIEKLDSDIKRLAEPGDTKDGEIDLKKLNREIKYWGLTLLDSRNQLESPVSRASLKEFMPQEEKTALAIQNNVRAGYLQLPEMFVAEIIDQAVREISPVRTLARVFQTMSNRMEIPAKSASGVSSWVAELGTTSEDTTLTFGMEVVDLHKMTSLVKVTEEMLADSAFNLQSYLVQEYSESEALLEGTAFVLGTGAGQPEGLTLSTNGVSTTNSGNANTLTADGLLDLFWAVKSFYVPGAVWLARRATIGVMSKLKTGTGDYIFGSLAGGPGFTLQGHPIIETPDMPALTASSRSVIFGNIQKGYSVLDKASTNLIVDPYSSKATGVIDLQKSKRVGGQVTNPEAYRIQVTSA